MADDPTKQRPGDQPLPVPNDETDIQTLVMADIRERREIGISRYGTALQPNNGRDPLQDLYEELMDALMYTKQLIVERDRREAAEAYQRVRVPDPTPQPGEES